MRASKENKQVRKEELCCELCYGSLRQGTFHGLCFQECRSCRTFRFFYGTESLLKEYYEGAYGVETGEESKLIWQSRRPMYVLFLRKLEKAGKRGLLLDVGCGYGMFLKLAQERGWPSFGLEPVEKMRKSLLCSQKTVFSCWEEVKNLETLFKIITFWNSLDFSLHPRRELEEAYRLLEEGGLLYLRLPNPVYHLRAWALSHRFVFLRRVLFPVFHVHAFYPFSLKKVLPQLGFREVRIEPAYASQGEPYSRRSFLFKSFVALGKKLYYKGSVLVGRLSSAVISPSFQVWGYK